MKPLFCSLLSWILLATLAHASVPKLINYQGRLSDSNGSPTDANVSVSLRVYDSVTAGSLTYSENIGTIEVKNGIYSFQFGNLGSSTRRASETFGPTDGALQVFNHTASNTPLLIGSTSITDGNTTWNEGIANPTLTGNVTHSSGAISAVYLTGVPAAGKTLTLAYDYNSSGMTGALLDNNESWMEVVIDGLAFSPRKQLVAMPFALVANEALTVSGKINESQLTLSDSSSELMTLIADLQGQISQLRASVNSGKAESDKIIRQQDLTFSESFTDADGDLNSVTTGDSNATFVSTFKSYVSGQLSLSNDLEVTTNHAGSFNVWKRLGSFARSQYINYHTSHFYSIDNQGSEYKINFLYSDGTSAFSPQITAIGTGYRGPLYHYNPFPKKLVSSIEPWSRGDDNDLGTVTKSKLNRSYSPLPSGETVKIKLNLPTQPKSVIATRVDVLGQVLPSSALNYDVSDGNTTASGLTLSTKNDHSFSQNPTSLTLHFNCPSISTVTVRYWFKD